MNEENLLEGIAENPVTSPPVDVAAIKTEIQKNLQKELQTQIQTQIDAATAPLGSTTGYIATAALVISILSIFIFLLLRSGLNSRINSFITKFNNRAEIDEIASLKNDLKILRSENRELRMRLESLENKPAQTYISTPAPAVTLQKSPALTLQKSSVQNYPAKTPPPPTLLDKYADFISEFNELNAKEMTGYEKQSARQNFVSKYNVKFFSCVNYNERMNNPNLEPEFAQQSGKGDYWAYEVEADTFAVVPNVSSYTENLHVARAMGEVFNSNFKDGNYSNIRVVKPAIFKGMWRLAEKGELVLS